MQGDFHTLLAAAVETVDTAASSHSAESDGIQPMPHLAASEPGDAAADEAETVVDAPRLG